MEFYPTMDIKLATCLDTLGVPYRYSDPVTKEVQDRNGRPFEQCTYWFDIGDEVSKALCVGIVQAYEIAKPFFQWKKDRRIRPEYPLPDKDYFKLGKDHPLYDRMDALFMREAWLHQSRNDAEPMKLMRDNNRTVIMSTRASQETKDKIKKYL